jgi:hypothetical protein
MTMMMKGKKAGYTGIFICRRVCGCCKGLTGVDLALDIAFWMQLLPYREQAVGVSV